MTGKRGVKLQKGEKKSNVYRIALTLNPDVEAGEENEQLFFNSSFQITVFSLQSEINRKKRSGCTFYFRTHKGCLYFFKSILLLLL